MKIPCDQILYDQSNNYSREPFTVESCKDLAAEIAESGLTHPVNVVEIDHPEKKYKLVVGFRRFCAVSIILGEPEIKAEIRDDIEPGEEGFVNVKENLFRHDMSFWEECVAMKRLFPEDTSMTYIAKKMKHTRQWVRPRWLCWKSPPEVREQIRAGELSIAQVNLIILQQEKDQIAAAAALKAAARKGIAVHKSARELSKRKTVRSLKEIQRTMTVLMDNDLPEHVHVCRFACGEITDEQLYKYLGCESSTSGVETLDSNGLETVSGASIDTGGTGGYNRE